MKHSDAEVPMYVPVLRDEIKVDLLVMLGLHRSNFSHENMPAVIEGSAHDFLTDASRQQAKTDIGAIRGFRYATHVPPGPIKMVDIYHFIAIGLMIARGTIRDQQLKSMGLIVKCARYLLAAVAAGCALGGHAMAAAVDDYPNKPVRVIAASAPGGGTDIIGRVVAQGLSDVWPQQAIVDNRAGSAGTIATAIAVKSTPDGYTLLVQSLGVSYAGALRKNLPFDAVSDIAPVVLLASQPFLLAVHPSVPVSSVGELIQLAKSKPGQLNYGTGGVGGASHMATELFSHLSRIRLTLVNYKGTGPAMTAQLSGEIHLSIVGIATALPHIKAGKLRALGVTGSTRSPLSPDIPTISEAGLPGYEFAVWYGMFAPAKTPHAIVLKVNGDVNRVLQQPEIRQRFAALGVEALGGTEEQFAKYFRSEVAKWRKVIQEAGIQAD